MDAEKVTAGHNYELWVYSSEVTYNYNETTFALNPIPEGSALLSLPDYLETIDEEAFAGTVEASEGVSFVCLY